jgi:hypothetical protein
MRFKVINIKKHCILHHQILSEIVVEVIILYSYRNNIKNNLANNFLYLSSFFTLYNINLAKQKSFKCHRRLSKFLEIEVLVRLLTEP